MTVSLPMPFRMPALRRRGRVPSAALAAVLTIGMPGALPGQTGSPGGEVPVELLEARRGRMMDALDGRLAVVAAQDLRDIEGDYPQDSDYRESNAFFYLTGLEEPGGRLVLNAPRPGAAVLYLREREPQREVWTGARLGPGAEAMRLTGVEDVRPLTALPGDLEGWAAEAAGPVAVSGEGRLSPAVASALEGAPAGVADADRLLADLRLVKDADEIRRLREAIDITLDAQREAWRLARPGVHEYELEAAIEYVFRVHGAERVGFPSIVGSGPNTVVLHYDRNRRKAEAGDLVVADIGAEFGYYSADVTRTFPVSGTFTERQRSIYDLVLGAQEAGLREVRPGASVADVQAAARAYMDRHSGALCGEGSCSRYFIHGVSHWLGMDVHDPGSYAVTFEPGMVLTVEPGIYIPSEELGVRIEDDVLVTPDGHEVLSGALPRKAAEIEAVMREEPRWVRLPDDGSGSP